MNLWKSFINKVKAQKARPFTLYAEGSNLRISSPDAICNDGDHHVMIVKFDPRIHAGTVCILSDEGHTSMRHNYDPRAITEDVLDYFGVQHNDGELFITLPNVKLFAFTPQPHVLYHIQQPDGFKELDFAVTRFIKALHKIEEMYERGPKYGKDIFGGKYRRENTSKGGVNDSPRTLRPKNPPPGQGSRK